MSLAPTTVEAYKHTWKVYKQFRSGLGREGPLLPVKVKHITQFIAFLVNRGLAPSTITSYMSAISFIHKLLNLADPTKQFLVQKMMLGVQKAQPRADTRLPIMKATLKLLVQSVRNECNKYSGCMFSAMYLLAFHAFLRVGEFTVKGPNSPHTLQLNQINISVKEQVPQLLKINFHSYKHAKPGPPFELEIKAALQKQFCPVRALIKYLKKRSSKPGPLFEIKRLSTCYKSRVFGKIKTRFTKYRP